MWMNFPNFDFPTSFDLCFMAFGDIFGCKLNINSLDHKICINIFPWKYYSETFASICVAIILSMDP